MVRINYGGGRGGGRGGASAARSKTSSAGVMDARLKIINRKRSEITDARDMLAKIAKGTDAREKLQKIRNLKAGKLEVKKTKQGAITITKTTQGKLLLTTKKKEHHQQSRPGKKGGIGVAPSVAMNTAKAILMQSKDGGKVNRKIAPGNKLSLSTKNRGGTALRPGAGIQKRKEVQQERRLKSSIKPLTRTIKGELSEAARLDDELLNTHVDPVILKRTVKQNPRPASPPARRYVPTRDVSPVRSHSPIAYEPRFRRGGYRDYDDPRNVEEEYYRRRLEREEAVAPSYPTPRTMADRLDSMSPLQGAKVVVSNLQTSVSQEDIIELFGDIGPLKRAKIVDHGVAEVVFVNMADAKRAVEIYHNRQLDGQAMKCQVVGAGASTGSSSFRLGPPKASSSSESERHLNPEMNAIYKALFNEKSSSSQPSSKPMFSVTMSRSKR